MRKKIDISSFAYHFVLWAMVLVFFIVLDFAKELDEFFAGSNILEPLANLFAPALLAWLVASILATFGLLAETRGWLKAAHFCILFVFITINLWSLRTSPPNYYIMLELDDRLYIGIGCLAVALLLALLLAKKTKGRIAWLDKSKWLLLKILAIATVALIGPVVLLKFVVYRPASQKSTRTPNIIIVTFDALSAKELELYGYPHRTAPNIEELAKESIVFDNFRSNYTYTPPALTAIQGNLAFKVGSYAWGREPGLFDILVKAYPNQGFFGYYSAYVYFRRHLAGEAITRSGQKSSVYRLFGYFLPADSLIYLSDLLSAEARTYWPYNGEYDDDIFWRRNHFPEGLSFEAALDYLEKNPKGSLVWVHTWAPHYPYWPDNDVAEKFGAWSLTPADFINVAYQEVLSSWVNELRKRYDASIYSVDRSFGKFLDELKKRGFYDNSILIVGSDHGESHANGFVGHSGASVAEEITHIPMLIHLPGQKEQVRVSTLASQLDLTPTILELIGFKPPSTLSGKSLVPSIKDPKKKDSRVHFTVSYFAFWGEGGDVALYQDHYKVVYSSFDKTKIRLYDLSTDPDAVVDIAAEHKDIAAKIMKKAGALE